MIRCCKHGDKSSKLFAQKETKKTEAVAFQENTRSAEISNQNREFSRMSSLFLNYVTAIYLMCGFPPRKPGRATGSPPTYSYTAERFYNIDQ